MSFMELEVTEKMDGYEVETTHGTWYLPIDATGEWDALEQTGREFFADYVEGGPKSIESVKRVHGYFARYSAPGYMDCTDWSFGSNRHELEKEVRRLYGDDD